MPPTTASPIMSPSSRAHSRAKTRGCTIRGNRLCPRQSSGVSSESVERAPEPWYDTVITPGRTGRQGVHGLSVLAAAPEALAPGVQPQPTHQGNSQTCSNVNRTRFAALSVVPKR